MNRVRNIKVILLIFLYVTACSDSSEQLSGDYIYVDEGVSNKFVISKSQSGQSIYGKVIAYDYNEEFIVVMQQPNFDDHKSKVAFELRNDIKKYP